ncbi:N-acetyl sugar amidotransferase [Phaeodactylibacter xiamenensis]|uniref:N-acetyl sugar amidotransferase n=1 Tax=Phaeodactylibacter xiamenensis TaxID=1524460 RepID=UPI0024A9551C|nr:N-acetyl sugar amidotransferase [Phaeodactylibacter xiamenensis]
MKVYNEEQLKIDLDSNFGRSYQQCAISVMDTIADPAIKFDEKGISNYYTEFKKAKEENVYEGELGKKKLNEIVLQIKGKGKNKKYDCITGVSGGVDSTYVALKAKELGLRPLIVHFDNGWNSERANQNIQNIIENTGFDLYTLVVDWNEFRDLQRAYFKANVVDIEALTDHAIICTLYKLAKEHNIKYILSGANIVTEHILPNHWIWGKTDGINIRAIHRKFGEVKLKTFPTYSAFRIELLKKRNGIQTIPLLDYIKYNKAKAKIEIQEKLGWKDYGGKHFESVFTRFYQGYILPVKFGIDKRKAHLSTLIFDGQIRKEEALKELQNPIYDEGLMAEDYEFVRKKLGFSEQEFENYFDAPRVEHDAFEHDKRNIWKNYPALKILRPIWNLVKKMR